MSLARPLQIALFVLSALLCARGFCAEESLWRSTMATAADAAKRDDHATAVQLYEAAARQTVSAFHPALRDARLAEALSGAARLTNTPFRGLLYVPYQGPPARKR